MNLLLLAAGSGECNESRNVRQFRLVQPWPVALIVQHEEVVTNRNVVIVAAGGRRAQIAVAGTGTCDGDGEDCLHLWWVARDRGRALASDASPCSCAPRDCRVVP